MSAYDSYQRKLNELRVKFWHEINNEREALPFVVEYVKMLEEEIQQTIRFSKWYINVPFPEMRNIKNNNNHNKNNDKYNY
jgi:hypothetical protein